MVREAKAAGVWIFGGGVERQLAEAEPRRARVEVRLGAGGHERADVGEPGGKPAAPAPPE